MTLKLGLSDYTYYYVLYHSGCGQADTRDTCIIQYVKIQVANNNDNINLLHYDGNNLKFQSHVKLNETLKYIYNLYVYS